MATDSRSVLGAYLQRVERELRHLSETERHEILLETRSHVLDRVNASGFDVVDVLDELGVPEEYARRFIFEDDDETETGRLRTVLRAASDGGGNFATFLVALFASGMSLFCVAVGALKVVHPERTGLWVDYAADPPLWTLSLRAGQRTPSGVEILGWWYALFAVTAALALFLLASLLLRRLSRRRRPAR